MTLLTPPRVPKSPVARRPVWLSRPVVLAADALFGAVLLLVALGGRLSLPSPGGGGAPQGAAVKVAARLGGLSPAGQSTGFAVAADGSLAVVDRGREVVMRLSPSGQPQAEWGPHFGPGLDAGDLVGIAPDGDGWYLLDRGAQRILHLDGQGQAQADRTINLEPLATYGPNGLATDGHGNLFMADTGRDRIVVFDAGGTVTRTIGDSGTELGKLKQPMFLAFGADGSLFVSDWENGRVQRWDAAGQAANAWPVPVHAWGIGVDGLGRVFVPDGDHHAVRMFGPDGALLAQFGTADSPPLPVEFPSQVGVSPDGARLWVLGADGLAAVDISAYAGIKPAPAASPMALPLAALGALLLLLAAAGAFPQAGVAAVLRLRPALGVEARPGRPAAGKREAAGGTRSAAEGQGAGEGPGQAGGPRWQVVEPPPLGWAWPLGVGLLALGGVGALLAEVAVADPAARLDPWPKLAWLALASLILAAGCVLSARRVPWQWVTARPPLAPVLPVTTPSESPAPGPTSLSGGAATSLIPIVAVTLLAVAATFIWSHGRFQTPDAARGAVLWLAALLISLTFLLATGSPRRQHRHLGLRQRLAPNAASIVIPWALFALALAPRAWHNADLPYGVWFDEAEAGLEARKFLQTLVFTPITDTYGRDASLWYYFIAAAQSVVPDPVLAGRLVAAITGAGCAPLVYLLGRQLFGWRVGLVAGLVMAASRWQLDISRLGWDPISLPFCASLAFWLLARAVRTRSWTDAAWAGLGLGLGWHAYIGFRPLPLVGLVVLAYAGWQHRWPFKTVASRLAAALATAVLAALPVIVFAIQDPAGFTGRLTQTLILSEPVSHAEQLAELWANIQKHALMFHISGDLNGRHNLPGAPMLDPLSGGLLVVGLAVLVLRPLDWRSVLLLGWAAVSMAGGIVTLPFEAPQAMRTSGVTPVLALLVGLALILLADRLVALGRASIRLASPVLAIVVGLAVAWIGYANISLFFDRQMNDPTVWESFSTRETIPSREAAMASTPFEAILGSPTIAPTLQQQLLVPGLQGTIRSFDATTDLPYGGSGPSLVILETEHDAGLAEEVARYYPEAIRRSIVPPNGARPTVDEIQLDSSVIAAHRGVLVRYQGSNGVTVDRRETSADLLADAAPVALPASVAWRAALAVDTPGSYAFHLPPESQLTIDGAAIEDAERLQLARGNHVLNLSGQLVSGASFRLTWRTPGGTDWRAIDDRSLFVAPDGGNGLQATAYPTADFAGSPTETTIDPILDHYYHVNPLARINQSPPTWSIEWRGELDAPTTGTYRFETERLSRAGLWLDGRQIFDDTVDTPTASQAGVAALSAGRHAIRVRLQNRGDGGPRLYLYWIPPGGGREVVPGRDLYPPPPAAAGLDQ